MSWLALTPLARAAPGAASAQPAATNKPVPPSSPAPNKPAPPAGNPVAAPAGAPPVPAATPSKAPLAASPNAVSPVAAPPVTAAPLGKPNAKLPGAKNPVDAAIQHVVMLERGGRPIGVGTLLSGDGRILTALSPLTHGNQIDAHYPEGQIVRVKLTHSDRAWDLALLTPEVDSRHAGLKASRDAAPAAGTQLHAVGYVRDKQLGASNVTIKAKSTLRGGDSAELNDALELPFAPKPNDIGGPLVDDNGEVVAIVARACSAADKVGCTLTPYAAPVSAVRNFLRGVPQRRGPRLGLEAVAFDAGVARGVRVAAIAAGGPAAAAGLRGGPPGVGDVVLAVDGVPVASAEAFSDAVENHASPEVPVRLLVLTEGRYREVSVMVREVSDRARPPNNDRVFQSNPSRPRPGRPASVPNPPR